MTPERFNEVNDAIVQGMVEAGRLPADASPSYEYTGVSICTPTQYATIGREPVYLDDDGLFLGGMMHAQQRIEGVEFGEVIADAYGHLGKGVVVHVTVGGRVETGCVLLDASRTLADVIVVLCGVATMTDLQQPREQS